MLPWSEDTETIFRSSSQAATYLPAVPSLQGGQGGSAPPNGCFASSFWFTQNILLKHHVTKRQQSMVEKGIISFDVLSILCQIAGNQLLYINVTQ